MRNQWEQLSETVEYGDTWELNKVLGAWGAEGWELVNAIRIDHSTGVQYRLFFKRPKAADR